MFENKFGMTEHNIFLQLLLLLLLLFVATASAKGNKLFY